MAYLIGMDEAGYGPNLGPLVISATVWRVPGGVRGEDLYGLLDEVIVRRPGKVDGDNSTRVAMADSKVLYKSGAGLRQLERGLLAALGTLGRCPASWREVWQLMAPGSSVQWQSIPWYADYQSPVPLEARPGDLEPLAGALHRGLRAAGVKLVELRSRAVFAGQFNDLLGRYGSKGEALSRSTLELLAEVIQPLEVGPISIICDKHGGRNRYGQLLGEHFPDWLIEVRGESRPRSAYRFGPPERRVEIRFQTKAEIHLPVALASMASKYLRELAMRALNSFWCRRVPGLRRTAGYPQDARRFKADIAAVQAELGITDHAVWRAK